jgi:catechol-2,3-dioxygenase
VGDPSGVWGPTLRIRGSRRLNVTATSKAGIPRQLSHAALRVRDLDSCVEFYTQVVGLTLHRRGEGAAFLGAREDVSHELALFALPAGAADPDPERVGMYHLAWEMSSFEELQTFHDRLVASGARIAGYSDRQCNVMFLDPDGNEQEAFWEVPHELSERARQPGGTPLPRLTR